MSARRRGSVPPKRPEQRRRKSAQPLRAQQDQPAFLDHPVYGRIPLIHRGDWIDRGGRAHPRYGYDLDFQPELPAGAVRGDPHRQMPRSYCNLPTHVNHWNVWGVPRYFYLDEPRTCAQCGSPFTFSGTEQKYWYERLGFHPTSHAIRCPDCRRKRRSQAALGRQAGDARTRLQSNPDDVGALLDLANAVTRYYQRTSQGSLDEAIAASRRVRKLAPEVTEAMFWEGLCQLLASRRAKARDLLQRFVRSKPRAKQQKTLFDEARGHLIELSGEKDQVTPAT